MIGDDSNLLNFFLLLLSKANQGFWSLAGDETLVKQEPCDIKWRIYQTCTGTVKYSEHCVEDGINMFTSEFYNTTNNATVLYSNPFYNNFSHYNVEPMIEALVSRCDFNVIALDNTLHTNAKTFLDYPLTMLQVYEDSKRYAKVLNAAIQQGLFSAKDTTALGFSLGAQLCGHVCRLLTDKCGQILAVDPAGVFFLPKQIPLIKHYPHLQLVSRSDACDVVFVECNRWMMGTGFRSAHKNIVVNNGMFQPSCFPGNILCSHEFCNKLVINAIRNLGSCVASTSIKYFTMFFTNPDQSDVFTLSLPLSEGVKSCNNEQNKVFYISTSDEPKCLGEKGSQGTGVLNTVRHSFSKIGQFNPLGYLI